MEIINSKLDTVEVGGELGCLIACVGGCLLQFEVLSALAIATMHLS
ncbi:hypothetical protein Calkr_0220 [Caldicellulosiruptor acetigenus I77R1B]|uniref:Uncharacterized protein n=1 Tax=Caldicellulosiruptor acetigenus (strain ATCC 700853 / DSM 12137 / I77R1B) TaxID=632335 RepID=E4S710_CALA7|nr:hypothetical protein Calkr_0220 [Caldicellulosiruptor acetigenus I77R1B]